MKPRKINHRQGRLFESRLSNLLDLEHGLIKLSKSIDWSFFEEEFGKCHKEGSGQPPKPIRLMVGLIMLQHMFDFSDEKLVRFWVENPYWQYFCGYDYLQQKPPVDSSSLVRFRKRLGEEGVEKILQVTIRASVKEKMVKKNELKKVIVDTTVMEKNIAFPTDARLLNVARVKLVKLAKKLKVKIRQSYDRTGKKLATMAAARYAHAKQFKRMRNATKKLKNRLGRVVRDIERNIHGQDDLEKAFSNLLTLSKRLIAQKKQSKNKLYSLHEPSVYCIAKGKARKPYEFGCKVALTVTHKKGLVLSAQALEKPQHDSKTLRSSLENAEKLSDTTIQRVFVDKGYRGHDVQDKQVIHGGRRKSLTPHLLKELKRRSAIEPHIGHMKSDGKLARNYLAGVIGDRINAILCAIGHNLRMLKSYLQPFFNLTLTGEVRLFLTSALFIITKSNFLPKKGNCMSPLMQ